MYKPKTNMHEQDPSRSIGDIVTDPVAAELEATQSDFESISSTLGLSRQRLQLGDAEMFIAFDDWASFEGNSDTPPTHRPEHFRAEDVRESMLEGNVFEGLFDADSQLVATMWLAIDPEASELDIANLVVHPEFRDKSIGKYFMNAAEKIARVRGLESCTLHVDPLNGRGMYLYSRAGFRVTGYEHDSEGGLQNWLIMSKKLDGSMDKLSDVTGKIDPGKNIIVFAKPKTESL